MTEEIDDEVSLERSTGQQDVVGRNVGKVTQPKTNLTVNEKRTSSTYEEGTSSREFPEVQGTPAKRARLAGPVPGRPMQLKVVRDAASFYPGYGGAASLLDPEATDFLNSANEEPPVENEDDWIDNWDMTTLAQGTPSKMVEARAFERPLWVPDTSACEPLQRDIERQDLPASSQHSSGSAATLQLITESTVTSAAPSTSIASEDLVTEPPTWPPCTDLTLIKTAKVIRKVITNSFEGLQASLLFENAFLDPVLSVSFIREALITSASVHGPSAADMQLQLVIDIEYLNKIVPVPCARMSHFRAEVKEACSALIFPILTAMVAPVAIASFVQDQLSNYNYTFPKAPKGIGHGNLVMHSKPYRNEHLIRIICDEYFTSPSAGKMSFATWFKYLFQNIEDDGATVYKVPIPMVALVATAMYATLYEWRTGHQQHSEFSANTYLDIYKGHVNTLQLIKDHRYGAFHTTMLEIYSKASFVADDTGDIGALVAVLSDLDE
ncbi:hypothetical protein EI94DRAFT_1804796 [Lactarius quietus]|nr:hypothetical protein EI94DRAFT_1804796 [Lactarius quietus]